MQLINKQGMVNQDSRLGEAVYFVECNHDEFLYIWKEFADEWPEATSKVRIHFEQDHAMKLVTIGAITVIEDGKMTSHPMYLLLNFCKLDGQLVCFYEPHGRFMDFAAMEKFAEEVAGTNRCNVANFHHCLHFIKELANAK